MKLMKLIASLALVLFSLQTTAFAWGDTGHMTVAQIAFDNLASDAKRDRADELANLIVFYDKEYEFVTSACWMDDIRDAPMFEPLKDWHFITQRYIINNAVPDEPPPPINAASIIFWLATRISSKDESDLKKAYYLAELTHLIGDIHQPLHCVTRFTPSEKEGDRGGNFFSLSEAAPRKNLHSYWDAAGGFFAFRDIGRPLTDNRRSALRTYANKITSAHPKSSMTDELKKMFPMDWAKEGFDLGVSDVYKGIKEDDVPSDKYEENARKVSARRIALAGYRLATILNKAL
jgi:S1/P1 Nuclease